MMSGFISGAVRPSESPFLSVYSSPLRRWSRELTEEANLYLELPSLVCFALCKGQR